MYHTVSLSLPTATHPCELALRLLILCLNFQTLTFDEFVDLFSVFSARAPKSEKIKVAFRMYDFDDNGFIDPVDLEMVIETMLKLADDDDKERLSEEERICIIQKVFRERCST